MKEILIKKYYGVCPECEENNNILQLKRKIKITVKNEIINTEEEFCRCEKCNFEFETADVINKNNIYAIDEYRKNHKLLTSIEIKAIRNKYKMTQVEFSWLIGVGEKTITRYETKQIQEESNDKLMRLVDSDYNFALQNLKLIKDKFEIFRYNELLDVIKQLIIQNNYYLTELSLENDYVIFDKLSLLNGYKLLDIPKIKSMISYFTSHTKNVFKVKLMKLFWYTDAKSYLDLGNSMSGLVYKHQNFGALPIGYQKLMELDSVDIKESLASDGNVLTELVPKKQNTFNAKLFSSDELKILKNVCKAFENSLGSEISYSMHKEDAYINTKMGDYIPFNMINKLKAI